MTETESTPNRGSLTYHDVERIRKLYNGYEGAFGTVLHFVIHPGKLRDAMRLETHHAFADNRINARSSVEDINQILHEYVRTNANAEELVLRRTRAIQVLSLGTVGVWGGVMAGASGAALGLIPLVDIAAKLSIGSGLATVPTLLLSDRAAVLRSRRLQRPQPRSASSRPSHQRPVPRQVGTPPTQRASVSDVDQSDRPPWLRDLRPVRPAASHQRPQPGPEQQPSRGLPDWFRVYAFQDIDQLPSVQGNSWEQTALFNPIMYAEELIDREIEGICDVLSIVNAQKREQEKEIRDLAVALLLLKREILHISQTKHYSKPLNEITDLYYSIIDSFEELLLGGDRDLARQRFRQYFGIPEPAPALAA